jgi:alcohol dehydrogenase
MSQKREAWRIDRAGSLERLRRVSEPIAPPGPGEARIAVRAVGLNFADIFACLGLYSATPKGSFVPGLEVAGVVEGLGPPRSDEVPAIPGSGTGGCAGATANRTVLPGARVVGLTRFGGYTTALNLDTRYLRALPDSWSYEQGAAFPVQALTAWYGLVRLARVERDEMVLVHSAAGGVGLNALQILRKLGARAISTVGDPTKREFLVAHAGAEPASIIVRDPGRFGAQLDTALQAAGATGLDATFDAIAGPYFTAAFERLRPEGRHVVYGAAHFMTRGARPN